MPRKHGRSKVQEAVLQGQADACARAIMRALGIDPKLIPGDIGPRVWEKPLVPVRPSVVLPGESGRLRRTNQELLECEQLRDWQLARRAGEVSNFVIEVRDATS